MKKFILALFSVVVLMSVRNNVKAQYLYYEPASKPVSIEAGWYKASVKYTNTRTYAKGNYTLRVKVEYGKVTAIDFGNGGSVHTGYNNEGYNYQGGTLTYEKDYKGEITGVACRVMVSDSNGIKYYDVSF
ncbi:MAG: hypothetical protein EOP47_05195 [Sphingobacteriaceae bacterium]|nr:MAG: hypothetical protein EOP47_05195 [Sphingobacteriaceae bacterium]